MEQQRNKKKWVLTKAFYGLIAKRDEKVVSKEERIIFDEDDPARLVKELEQIRHERITRISIIDLAIMPEDRTWAFVEDSINRSGSNPMRKIRGLSEDMFIDLGQLYMVPKGQKGITVLSLGARFEEEAREQIASCGHLHTISVIAHAMNLEVSAIVVSEEKFNKAAFSEIERLC